MRKHQRSKWAAWLGIAALAVNAAVPVVVAFLLAAALAPQQHEWAQLGGGNWQFYAPLCHHDDGGDAGGTADQHGKSPGAPCPVCSLHGAIAVTLPSPAAPPSDAVLVATAAVKSATAVAEPAVIFPAGYRSRAPPFA
jgi:hypothetical protein